MLAAWLHCIARTSSDIHKQFVAYSLLLLFLVLSTNNAQAQHVVTTLNPYGTGSLISRISAAQAGDTITFSPSLLSNGSDTIHFNATLTINKGLTIIGLYQGADTLFLDGQNQHQLFYVDMTGRTDEFLCLENLAIVNGQSSTNGGGVDIVFADSIIIKDCLFKRNRQTPSTGNGGGLRIADSRSWISGCVFHGNIADGRFGGGCRILRGYTNVESCSFTNNTSYDGGGGLAIIYATYEVANCEFTNNSCSSTDFWGGAGFYSNTCVSGILSRCKLSENLSYNNGGGAYFQADSSIVIDQCFFEHNSTTTNGGSSIHANSSNITISNSSFTGNFGADGFYMNNCNLVMTNCTFYENNSQTEISGGIRDSARFKNCSFVRDTSSSQCFLNLSNYSHGEFTIEGCLFSGDQNMDIVLSNGASSLGYNAFHKSYPNSHSTDLSNISKNQLDLGSLQDNGGFAPTILAGMSSPTIDAGNPNEYYDAQNGPIFGVSRDIGAAETPIIHIDTIIACGPVSWWGNTFNDAGVYTDTAQGWMTIDSIGVLVITELDTTVSVGSGELISGDTQSNTMYLWLNCDSAYAPITTARSATFSPTVNGSYAVQIRNGLCIDTSECVEYNQVSIREAVQKQFSVYPNPASSRIFIKTDIEIIRLEILNSSGQLLRSIDGHKSNLDISDLTSGLYVIKWHASNTTGIERVIISRSY
ncbi:MAG: right-handed parallel beta-helix repeat-containing protein [Flavobacteriia bacterium]|nr:right-handed parallel beta-helix repeat-containing protein [Flavobacteriia bacterium]